MPDTSVRQLVEEIAKALVDKPEGVTVTEAEDGDVTVLELRVADGDMGKVIGKQGRTARSIRTVVNAATMNQDRRYQLEIIE